MARRRSLWTSISTSRKVTEYLVKKVGWRLAEFAQLLFTWLIPHCDDWGRFHGSAFDVHAKVMPKSKRSEDVFEKVLDALDAVGLIQLYLADGKRYLCFPDWEKRQKGLRLDRRTKSDFPDPPEVIPGTSGKSREGAGNPFYEDEVEVEVKELFNPPYPPEGGGEVQQRGDWTEQKAKIFYNQAPKQWQPALLKKLPEIVLAEPISARALATMLDVREGRHHPSANKPWIAVDWILKRLKDRKRVPSDANYDKAKKLLRRKR